MPKSANRKAAKQAKQTARKMAEQAAREAEHEAQMEEQRNIESLIDAKRSRPGLGTLRLALTDFHQKRLLASGRREQPVTLSPFPIGARSRAARDRLTQTRLDPAWARAISARAAEAKEERERLERERRWERISRKEAGPLVLLAWRRYKTRILGMPKLRLPRFWAAVCVC